MNQQKPQLIKSNGKGSDYGPSPTKSQAELRRQKKKKMAAFKTFLNNVEPQVPQDPLIKRRLSGELMQQKLQPDPQCKICKNVYGDKGKQCSFCHDIVCSSHIRKKRRDPNNKFSRICDLCEDTYIYKRYLKNQMKIEETLIAQELLLEAKVKELKQMLNGKKTKLIVIKNKAQELQNSRAKQTQKYTTQKTDLERKLRKLEEKMCDLSKLQKQLIAMQKRLPPSLQTDYQVLEQQNEKITKDLVKYEKWCNDVIKARSIREKKMYEQYYEWQLMQKNKRNLQQKQQECDIY